ncbi:MAG TPA: hypothetical protein VFF50_01725 [Candidatus Deferrimicrobiaceae bacterium]|jgi:hypothetical protein|nr:hypothetical protein [Candidatus Deferrimicrobiaceae bacterium]
MSVPLRKDEFVDENLTTADLAEGKRAAASEERLALKERLNDEPRNNARNNDGAVSEVDEVPVNERTVNDHINDDRMNNNRINNDRINSDRPGPVLAERRTVDAGQSVAETRRVEEPHKSADAAPLFPGNELEELRSRWSGVQTAFVDEPRRAVEQADGLVASAMKRLAEVFAEERSKLEKQWDRGDSVSTEDLRVALQRYRSFFQRLLSV